MSDKNDRVMDEMIRRFEALEERVEKGLKQHVAEKVVNLRKDIKVLTQSVDGVAAVANEAKEMVKGVEDGLKNLEKTVEKNGCKCEHDVPSGNASGHNQVGYQRGAIGSGAGTENRGMENTQQSYGQQQAHYQQQQQHGGTTTISQAPSTGRQSNNSGRRQSNTSGGRRSNTTSVPDDGGRPSGERSGRRAYFTQMGRAIGPEPDLRAHPAFAGAGAGIPSQDQVWPHAYGQNEAGLGGGNGEVVYHVPPYSGGLWYQQAYGQ